MAYSIEFYCQWLSIKFPVRLLGMPNIVYAIRKKPIANSTYPTISK